MKRSDERPFNPAHRFRHTFIQIGSDPEELGGLEIHPYRVAAAVDHVEEEQIMTTKVYAASDSLEKKLHTAQRISDRIELLTGPIGPDGE